MIVTDSSYRRAGALDATDKWERYRAFADETFPSLRAPIATVGDLWFLAWVLVYAVVLALVHCS